MRNIINLAITALVIGCTGAVLGLVLPPFVVFTLGFSLGLYVATHSGREEFKRALEDTLSEKYDQRARDGEGL